MRWSLRARFLLVLIILMISIFGAITLLIVRQDRITLRNNLIAESKSFAALATQPIGNAFVTYKDSGTLRINQEVASFTDLDNHISSVEITDTNGNNLFTNSTNAVTKLSPDLASRVTPTYIYSQSDVTRIVQPYLESYGIHRYNVIYAISYTSVDQSIQKIVTSILILSAAILVFSLAIWYVLINWLFLRPVDKVSEKALLVSKGDLDQQIHLNRNDEIGDLASAVSSMATSLKADINKLKEVDDLKSEFLMITAHSLRTPLAIMKEYIQIIKDSAKKGEDLSPNLEAIMLNLKKLDHFAEDALTISTMEEGDTKINLTPTDITPEIQKVVDEFQDIAKQKGINFKAEINVSAKVNLNVSYFRSALWNLLDNAYKFTPKGGSISLNAQQSGSKVEIRVSDSGVGIAEEEIPKLFTKFHRATSTLEYNYEGTGIGLYLTKLIAEQHGGSISLDSTSKNGTTFLLTLPLALS